MSEYREKVVLDTNIMLSALMSPNGTSAAAVASVLMNNDVVQSAQTYAELGEKLASKKLQKYIPADLRQQALDFFAAAAEFVEAPCKHTACRDPKDNKFLDIADAGGAVTLVTGDKDLLALQGQEKALGMNFNIMSGRNWLDLHPLPVQAAANDANASVPSMFTLRQPVLG
jgi:putative PIN family toxin of toxin-antitoxin system